MRILVTGHRGYIGPGMVSMLVADGHKVVGLDSDIFAECAFYPSNISIPEIHKDIRDVELSDLEEIDAVIHLAALSNDPIGDLNPDITYEINYQASVRLAWLAREAGCSRFLFSSSCSIYGAAGDEVLTEEARFNPVTPYGHSKVLVERDVSALAGPDFSPVFLRNATAYGASPQLRFDLVINNLVAYACTTGLVYLKSDGTPWRPVVHIEDITRAFIAALNAPREVIHNQAFNVGINEENYRVRELAEIVKDIIPGCRIEYAPDANPDKRTYRVDFSKIARVLPEFKPQWNVPRGVAELYAVYQEVGLKREDFEGPKYKRIDYLKQLIQTGSLGSDLRWRKELLASMPPSSR